MSEIPSQEKRLLEMNHKLESRLKLLEAVLDAAEYRISKCKYKDDIHEEMCVSRHATMHCDCGADQLIKAIRDVR